ncbi:hypothetical protein HYC85_015934 [Camellia sinensis]|uniref:Jasmonic acid-amido synthetase JAR1 n=1 Tax=Camellia sinensis TaxID=4442 RepID=A0A7J7H1Y5_CAMSI|nr:hypothetical protein HYC85_015934 [Camellia sinensis]
MKEGLAAGTATTSVFSGSLFKNTMKAMRTHCCSPDEVIFGPDFQQSLYCHLLSGLIYWSEVQVVSSTFAHSIVYAFRTFEQVWEELCTDIRERVLTSQIIVPSIRTAMSKLLKPNPELADKIHKKCSGLSNWYGLIPELFPNAKYIYGIMTGSMEPYLKKLRHYAGELPLLSANYGSSEGWIGANVNPKLPLELAIFAVLPNIGYFEFIPNVEVPKQDEIESSFLSIEPKTVGLTEVKVGEEYEIILTTFAVYPGLGLVTNSSITFLGNLSSICLVFTSPIIVGSTVIMVKHARLPTDLLLNASATLLALPGTAHVRLLLGAQLCSAIVIVQSLSLVLPRALVSIQVSFGQNGFVQHFGISRHIVQVNPVLNRSAKPTLELPSLHNNSKNRVQVKSGLLSRTIIHHLRASSSNVNDANVTFGASVLGKISNNFSISKTHASAFIGSIPPENLGGFIFLNSLIKAIVPSLYKAGCGRTCGTGGGGGRTTFRPLVCSAWVDVALAMLTDIGKTQTKLSEQTNPRGKPSVAKQGLHDPMSIRSTSHHARDVVKVVGFHNSTPELQFSCRSNLLLTINNDKNTEKDVQLSVEAAGKLFSNEKIEVVDFTSHVDLSTDPGHYVIFWEVTGEAGDDLLREYCNCLDRSFVDAGYVGSRKVKAIGSLELRVLRRGTFQKFLEHYVGLGAAVSQFKTPRCVGPANSTVLQILCNNVVKSYFSTAF